MGDRRTSRYIPCCFFLSWLLNVVQLASVQHQRQAQVTDEESEDHLCIRSCTSRVGASSSSLSPWHRSKRWRSHGFVFRRLFLRANWVRSMVCIGFCFVWGSTFPSFISCSLTLFSLKRIRFKFLLNYSLHTFTPGMTTFQCFPVGLSTSFIRSPNCTFVVW